MLAVITGVRYEQAAIDQHLEVLEQTQLRAGVFITQGSYKGKPVLTCRTGMGKDRVCGALPSILEDYPISAIVTARIARGIARELDEGDLAFCPRTLLRVQGDPLRPRQESDLRLLEMAGSAAQRANIPHVVGDCLTVWPVPEKAVSREVMAQQANLAVVDTDGYWVAETALEHELPFLSVRVAIGEGAEHIPQLLKFMGTEAFVSPWKVIVQNLHRPRQLNKYIRLGNSVRRSSHSLSQFFGEFLSQWEARPFPTSERQR